MKNHVKLALLATVAVIATLTGSAPASASDAKNPPAAPAGVQAGCWGSSCNGQDPEAMGCAASAYTMYEFTFRGYRVEHRRSTACHAVWTRATYVSGSAWMFGAYRETIRSGTHVIDYWNVATGWTSMYTFELWSRSCATSNTGDHCGPYV